MTEDATLDAFGSTEESTTSDASGAPDAESVASDESDASVAESADGAPAPPVPTSSWRPAGECAACGERVARRWRDGDERVCAGCVSWNASGGDACDQ